MGFFLGKDLCSGNGNRSSSTIGFLQMSLVYCRRLIPSVTKSLFQLTRFGTSYLRSKMHQLTNPILLCPNVLHYWVSKPLSIMSVMSLTACFTRIWAAIFGKETISIVLVQRQAQLLIPVQMKQIMFSICMHIQL